MLQKILCLILFSLPCLVTKAQNQTTQWYFGKQAHLDFQTNIPVLNQEGSILTNEGTATISDINGNLLFYTHGRKVWDKSHNVMQNGDSLTIGYTTSISQAAMIIPFPSNLFKYYLFSIDETGHLYYAIIDMALNNGLGAVPIKQQMLLDSVEEKMTAVHHCDGKSVWLTIHRYGSNQFYTYLIGANGINSPIISTTGSIHTISTTLMGCMTFSPDAKKIAIANTYNGKLELFDFDNVNGIVGNPFIDSFPTPNGGGLYGISFSPSSQFLYVTASYNSFTTSPHTQLYQVNLNLSDSQDIINSKILLYEVIYAAGQTSRLGGMSLAKDGKIYISDFSLLGFLDIIEHPNSFSFNCSFIPNFFYTNSLPNYTDSTGFLTPHSIGLPNFIQSYFCPLGPAYNNIIIEKDTILPCNSSYTLHSQGDWLSRQWSTGDTSESISVSQSGYYSITCVRKNGCVKTDTVHILIGETNANVTREGANLVAATNATYQWIDCNGNTPILGGTNQVFTPTVNGNYAVIVSDGLCVDTSACYPMLNVGIAASQGQKGLEVYPNPAQDEITFVWHKALATACELRIYHAVGSLVAQKELIAGTKNYLFSVENLTNGIYFYQISDGNSGKFSVVK